MARNQVANIKPILSPTEMDDYQLERVMDLYVMPKGENLGKPDMEIAKIIAQTQHPSAIRIDVRGLVTTMQSSFKSFGIGLLLSVLLVYIIMVAQFSSFIDPLLIILAVPTGLIGVIFALAFALAFTDTTLNIQSLMGIVMLTGMVVSNSILIVDFANRASTEQRNNFSRYHGRTAALGVETGSRKRSVCSPRSRNYRRTPDLGHFDSLCCACRSSMDL